MQIKINVEEGEVWGHICHLSILEAEVGGS